jgi:DNA-binding MarR family transcriptional regulator
VRRANLPSAHDRLLRRAKAQLDRAAYVTLARLADIAPARLGAIAESLGVDASTASRQVSTLERAGLVARVVDPDDRRASLVSITPSGAQTLDQLRIVRRQALAELLAGWAPADIATFAELATRFVTVLATMGDQVDDTVVVPAATVRP